MYRTIEDYVKTYKGVIDKEKCRDIVNLLDIQNFKSHTFHDPKTGEYSSHDEDLQVLDGGSQDPNFKLLMNTFKEGFNNYTRELDFPWFRNANSFCIYRYNKYPKNSKMLEHCDHIHSIFDGKRKGVPILTGLIFLNEGFEGGELVLFKDSKIETEAGDLMIFPSSFLYPHRVDKVLEGVRYSVVSWAW
jgi:hypothetical protein